ncbi:MAG TPA: hypothetical protein V6C99_08965 [Oculatellaceae cyanobacterium]|jgi:hypothetical protein
MNAVKMTALALSLAMVAGLFSGCNRSNVRTERVEETPYGESYVKETPEQKEYKEHDTSHEMEKKAGEVEQSFKKSTEEIQQKTEKAAQNLPFGKDESYSKKEVKEKTESKTR